MDDRSDCQFVERCLSASAAIRLHSDRKATRSEMHRGTTFSSPRSVRRLDVRQLDVAVVKPSLSILYI